MNLRFSIAFLFALLPCLAFAWGAEGHRMTAEVAKKRLAPSIKDSVKKYLDTTSFEQAATWMDDVRSDHAYDYMKPWHYTNIEKGGTYAAPAAGDMVSELAKVIGELRARKGMRKEDIAKDLRILFHLCGDISQPLHAGYGSDLGGNKVVVTFDGKQTNLHHVWDSDIIKKEGITLEACVAAAEKIPAKNAKVIEAIDPMAWMNDSRMLLPQVYAFTNGTIDDAYVKKNTPVVEEQVAKGGMRLAAVLNDVFGRK